MRNALEAYGLPSIRDARGARIVACPKDVSYLPALWSALGLEAAPAGPAVVRDPATPLTPGQRSAIALGLYVGGTRPLAAPPPSHAFRSRISKHLQAFLDVSLAVLRLPPEVSFDHCCLRNFAFCPKLCVTLFLPAAIAVSGFAPVAFD